MAIATIEPSGGIDIPLEIAGLAIGPEDLGAFDRSTAGHIVETGQHTAQRIGEIKRRSTAIQRPQQPPCQAVVIGVALVDT